MTPSSLAIFTSVVQPRAGHSVWAQLAGLGVALAAVGCGGPAVPVEKPRSEAKLSVRDAALPYRIVDARTGKEVSREAFYAALSAAEAICVGEQHTSPHDHWAQLEVLDKVTAAGGATWGLGMEMVQRPYQGVLDDFGAGRIDQAALLSRTGWSDRWGYDFALYEPMITLAVSRAASLVALNTERELLKKVSRKGLSTLTDEDRTRLPEMLLDVAAHRAWFDALMADMDGSHGHGHGTSETESSEDAPPRNEGEGHRAEPAETGALHDGSTQPDAVTEGEVPVATKPPPTKESMADRIYSAQVLWDETMAETAFLWLRQDPTAGPGRQIIVLAGNGHCHDTAIVDRLKRRGADKTVSIHPIVDDGEGNVADALATPMNDYLFVMTPGN